jgi:glycosyltransferase involved in cell wall biosynthesis
MPEPNSVIFLAPEPLAESPTGPARRTVKLAEVVAEHCRVTLAAPAPSTFPEGPFETFETGPPHDQRLAAAVAAHDVAVVQALPSPRQLLTVRRHARRLVTDLIAPLALELAEMGDDAAVTRAAVRWRARQMVAQLAAADLVLCTNEKQRDLVIGAALAAGIVEPDGTPLHRRVAVVPHGLDEHPPTGGESLLRRNGYVDEGDRIAVWGGGIWSWLDPLTAIRAIERLRGTRPELKLAFVGLDHPDPETRLAHEPAANAARAYVRDHGLERQVLFFPRWLAREDFVAHLREADVGVSLAGSGLESRYASRTRVLDYLSAGLPVVCTGGDAMSELVDARGFGCVVDPADVDGTAAALDRLTREPRRVEGHGALEPLLWHNVARPLVEFCAEDGPAQPGRTRATAAAAARAYPDFIRFIYRAERAGGLARAARRRLANLNTRT